MTYKLPNFSVFLVIHTDNLLLTNSFSMPVLKLIFKCFNFTYLFTLQQLRWTTREWQKHFTILQVSTAKPSQLQKQLTHQRRQDQGNGKQWDSMPITHSEWTTGAGGYIIIPWVLDYRRWSVYNGISYQVKQITGDWGIVAENMEKSQHTDFNKDVTNESSSMACSNIRPWKLDTQKEWKNTPWRLWDERNEKDSGGSTDSKENRWVDSKQSWSKEGTVDTVKARKLAYYEENKRKS